MRELRRRQEVPEAKGETVKVLDDNREEKYKLRALSDKAQAPITRNSA